MKSKRIRIIAVLVSAALILTGTAALLVYHGVILLNNPSKTEYPVRGVDVSSYQGEIDWGVLTGYTSALKAPVRCFGNHLSGKRKSWFRTDNDCGGAAILKTRTSRMGTPVGC